MTFANRMYRNVFAEASDMLNFRFLKNYFIIITVSFTFHRTVFMRLIIVMSSTSRFPSSIPYQTERSCAAGGRSSDTQLFASWKSPPTHYLDER